MVTRAQLREIGFSKKAIEHRLRNGRLHRVARGVYLVGWKRLDRERRWKAAVLSCGDGALLSHRSAGALWGFCKEHPDYVEVSVDRHRSVQRPGLRVHDRAGFWARDLTTHRGIPLTQPVRTFLDLVSVMGPRDLERAINEADKLDVIDADALRRALDNYSGQPGVRPLRRILDEHTFRLSDDELERLFRPIATAAGLSVPLTKHMLDKFEVDFFWPGLNLVVETDGWRYHRTPSAQTRDALRFQTHTAAGRTPLRFSHWQVKHEPTHVERILTATVANLRA